ncbi:cell division protein ZapA [Agaribacterium haliotis]|uniref:cell division protein ZapA n=1 Tax=Agaribacterium haliotis TaxID=2013869 RepID=UPI000BB5716B|nr:cell division protein ZapA [Agaribacterium haliotis]
MSDENRVTVNILDKDYQVACSPDERHDLMRAASELDARMRAVRKSGTIIGVERIAIMVALNLCHELMQGKAADNSADLSRLNQKLASALAGH